MLPQSLAHPDAKTSRRCEHLLSPNGSKKRSCLFRIDVNATFQLTSPTTNWRWAIKRTTILEINYARLHYFAAP